jgi:hypothetical protein
MLPRQRGGLPIRIPVLVLVTAATPAGRAAADRVLDEIVARSFGDWATAWVLLA